MSVRERRIANEWKFLSRLAEENDDVVQVNGRERICGGDWFYLTLKRTEGIAIGNEPDIATTEHRIRLHFPEYFPAVPIEAYLDLPVVHPNVHPLNGFVCLWNRFSPGDSVIQALWRLQRIISWEVWNEDAEHVMQELQLRPVRCLLYEAFTIPPELRNPAALLSSHGQFRRIRLSS